ncbi:MAG: phosphatidylserine decarboxylase [Candidatus Sumerlaeaceae bacterium]|nr:phosphatidylserine decarboxylase [Candidatus Sumerlaeaceae bacterium]
MKYRATTFPVANEAWPFAVPLAVVVAIALAFHLYWSATILGVLLVYVIAFFRNPQRRAIGGPDNIIAPADGKIVAAGIVSHPDFEDGSALRVAIFMSLFNCHVNWAPCGGRVAKCDYYPGQFLNAMDDKSSEVNERKVMTVEHAGGQTLIVKLVAGLVARRIVCPIGANDTLEAGEKIGLIRFGSRAEVLLPANSELLVKPGMMVRGGETLLAVLKPARVTTQESAVAAGAAS